jgi:hypothetical protein
MWSKKVLFRCFGVLLEVEKHEKHGFWDFFSKRAPNPKWVLGGLEGGGALFDGGGSESAPCLFLSMPIYGGVIRHWEKPPFRNILFIEPFWPLLKNSLLGI